LHADEDIRSHRIQRLAIAALQTAVAGKVCSGSKGRRATVPAGGHCARQLYPSNGPLGNAQWLACQADERNAE